MWQGSCVQSCVAFGPFRLDSGSAELRRGKRVIALRPEALALLRYLVDRHGHVVESAELIGAVWPDTVIADATLRACVGELRRALADTARPASYIETVPRRGYRFVAKVVVKPAPPNGRAAASSPPTAIVGRAQELAELDAAWRCALAGRRQVLLLSGEAGIGKTALLQAFLAAQERSLAKACVAH